MLTPISMMSLLAIRFPDIDPNLVVLHLWGLTIPIRWYGLAYVAGFLVAWLLLKRLIRRWGLPLDKEHLADLVTYGVFGVILGGRLGYVLIYKPAYYFSNPAEMIQIWDGGMSFHGGMLGLAAAIALFGRRREIRALPVLDAVVVVACPGLFFGRLANFINQELWGRPTDVPWAVIFTRPSAGGVPRHPSQIYEALLEGALLFSVLWFLSRKPAVAGRPGALTALFVTGYGALRFFVEFYREPDAHLGAVLGPFSMGHLLCGLMVVAGGFALIRLFRQDRPAPTP